VPRKRFSKSAAMMDSSTQFRRLELKGILWWYEDVGDDQSK
jgi:hypothetical protein